TRTSRPSSAMFASPGGITRQLCRRPRSPTRGPYRSIREALIKSRMRDLIRASLMVAAVSEIGEQWERGAIATERGSGVMKRKTGVLLAGAGALPAIFACMVSAEDSQQALLERARQVFKPLPPDAGTAEHPVTAERVALGKALFFESRVSSDGAVSCAKCHLP